jgi:hypothetical protein
MDILLGNLIGTAEALVRSDDTDELYEYLIDQLASDWLLVGT